MDGTQLVQSLVTIIMFDIRTNNSPLSSVKVADTHVAEFARIRALDRKSGGPVPIPRDSATGVDGMLDSPDPERKIP